MQISILESLAIDSKVLEKLMEPFIQQGHIFKVYEETNDLDQMIQEVKDADAIILANMPLPSAVIENAPNLKFIDVAFTGIDHIPVDECTKRNILISNSSGYATQAVAELVICQAISLLRKLPALEQAAQKGKTKEGIRGNLLQGKTIGIVGYGHIGKEVARLAKAFGCKTIGVARRKLEDEFLDQQVSLEELLKESDIVSLHTPLTEQTKGLIGKEQLALMKPTSILINTARGPVLNQQALKEAIEKGQIAGAYVDVFDQEPPLPMNYILLGDNNIVLTPHMAYDSLESMNERAEIVFKNLEGWLKGTPQNVVGQ